jgi:hypothetical protein
MVDSVAEVHIGEVGRALESALISHGERRVDRSVLTLTTLGSNERRSSS